MGWRGPPPPFYPSSEHTARDRCQASEIIPSKLYLTNFKGAEDPKTLQQIGCTHVRSMITPATLPCIGNSDSRPCSWPQVVAVGDEFVDKDGGTLIIWKKDISDDEHQGETMAAALHDAASFIANGIEGGGVVLVHCAAGISRSATVVLGYYLLHVRDLSLYEAFKHVFAARPCIWPNEAFMGALIALEQTERGSNSMTLAEYEYWGEYVGAEDVDDPSGASLGPPPRLVRDDTCLEAEERELHALAEASDERRRIGLEGGTRRTSLSKADRARAATHDAAEARASIHLRRISLLGRGGSTEARAAFGSAIRLVLRLLRLAPGTATENAADASHATTTGNGKGGEASKKKKAAAKKKKAKIKGGKIVPVEQ